MVSVEVYPNLLVTFTQYFPKALTEIEEEVLPVDQMKDVKEVSAFRRIGVAQSEVKKVSGPRFTGG